MNLLDQFLKTAVQFVYAKEALVDTYEYTVSKSLDYADTTDFEISAYDNVIKDYRTNLRLMDEKLDYELRAVLYYLDMEYAEVMESGEPHLKGRIDFLKSRSAEFRIGEAMIRAKHDMRTS